MSARVKRRDRTARGRERASDVTERKTYRVGAAWVTVRYFRQSPVVVDAASQDPATHDATFRWRGVQC